jgi:NAD+ diphosphatase
MMQGVLVVLKDGERFVLGRYAKDNALFGKWVPVTGKIEEGETPDEAAAREVKEETGITVSNVRKLGQVQGEIVKVLHVFEADVTGQDIMADTREFLEMKSFHPKDVMNLDLGGGTRRVFEEHYLLNQNPI